MQVTQVGSSEVAILNRILRPNEPTFSRETAQEVLALAFDQTDTRRMKELSAKARAGTLTAEEDVEAGKYEVVGHLLGILHSKARRSLKTGRNGDENKSMCADPE